MHSSVAIALLLAGCSCEEPRTVPLEVYLVGSRYCEATLFPRIADLLPSPTISIDLAVLDVTRTEVGGFPTLAASSCRTVVNPGTGDWRQLFDSVLVQIDSIIDELPVLPEDRAYGLIAGLYFGDAECGNEEGATFFCGMSTAFGEKATNVWRLSGDGGPPDDAIPVYMLCPSDGTPCVDEADCVTGAVHSSVVECAGPDSEPCRSDAACRSGITFCGEAGFCDLDGGACMRSTDEGGAEPCRGAPCGSGATCDDAGCFQADGGTACLRSICNDDTGLRLAGSGEKIEPITYWRCRSIHSQAFSPQ